MRRGPMDLSIDEKKLVTGLESQGFRFSGVGHIMDTGERWMTFIKTGVVYPVILMKWEEPKRGKRK